MDIDTEDDGYPFRWREYLKMCLLDGGFTASTTVFGFSGFSSAVSEMTGELQTLAPDERPDVFSLTVDSAFTRDTSLLIIEWLNASQTVELQLSIRQWNSEMLQLAKDLQQVPSLHHLEIRPNSFCAPFLLRTLSAPVCHITTMAFQPDFGDKASVQELHLILTSCGSLRALELVDCELSEEGTRCIVEGLANCQENLLSLTIRCNSFPPSIDAFADLLSSHHRLESFRLVQDPVKQMVNVDFLAKQILQHQNLRNVELPCPPQDPQVLLSLLHKTSNPSSVLESMGAGLIQMSPMQTGDVHDEQHCSGFHQQLQAEISWHRAYSYYSIDQVQALARGIASLSSLKSIGTRNNALLQMNFCQQLFAVPDCKVDEVDFRDLVAEESFVHLCRNVRDYPRLERIHFKLFECFPLDNLSLSPQLKEMTLTIADPTREMWSHLGKLLRRQPSLEKLSISDMDFLQGPQMNQWFDHFVRALEVHPSLKHLALNETQTHIHREVDPKESIIMKALTPVLKMNRHLQVLDLRECVVDISYMEDRLSEVKLLKKLWLDHDRISVEDWFSLRRALGPNASIVDIHQGDNIPQEIQDILHRNSLIERALAMETELSNWQLGLWPHVLAKLGSMPGGEASPIFSFLTVGNSVFVPDRQRKKRDDNS